MPANHTNTMGMRGDLTWNAGPTRAALLGQVPPPRRPRPRDAPNERACLRQREKAWAATWPWWSHEPPRSLRQAPCRHPHGVLPPVRSHRGVRDRSPRRAPCCHGPRIRAIHHAQKLAQRDTPHIVRQGGGGEAPENTCVSCGIVHAHASRPKVQVEARGSDRPLRRQPSDAPPNPLDLRPIRRRNLCVPFLHG